MPPTLSDPLLKSRLSKIKLLVFDVDGVLTDGTAYYDSEGMRLKTFSMRDGFGFVMAKFSGLELGAITGNVADMVKRRLEAFNITRVKGGHFHKTGFFNEMMEETNIPSEFSAYVGDDLFDIPVMNLAGFSIAPSDAHPEVLARADAVSSCPGGRGVVREVVEAIIHAQGRWDEVLEMIERDEKGGR